MRAAAGLAICFATSTALAADAPVVEAERALETPILDSSGPSSPWGPAIAYGGGQYLAVWFDTRSGYKQVFATRITPQGEILDRAGIAVSRSNDRIWSEGSIGTSPPAVGFDGQSFVVAWDETRTPSSKLDVYAARVSPNGTVVDPAGIAVSSHAANQTTPSIACNQGECLIAWLDSRSADVSHETYEVYGARLRASGTVVEPLGVRLSGALTGSSSFHVPQVAAGAGAYLVAWQHGTTSFGEAANVEAAVVAAGTPIAAVVPFTVAGSGHATTPTVSFDGTGFLVGYEDRPAPSFTQPNVYGVRVDVTGDVLDPAGVLLASGAAAPRLVADGTHHLLAMLTISPDATSRPLSVAQVSTSGVPSAGPATQVSSELSNIPSYALARGASGYLLVGRSLGATRLDATGAPLDPVPMRLARSANVQRSPAVDATDDGFFAAWVDERSEGRVDVYGARVSGAGAALDPSALRISDETTTGSGRPFAAVAFNGTAHLVVWATALGDVFGVRFGRDGARLDAKPIAILSRRTGSAVKVASNGTDFLVVWVDTRAGRDVYGARVRGDGTVVEKDGFTVSSFAKSHSAPVVDFTASSYLVAWSDDRNATSSNVGNDVYGTRISSEGAVLDPAGIPIAVGQDAVRYAPSVAHDGKQFLVAWTEQSVKSDPTTFAVAAATVDPATRADLPAQVGARSVILRDGTSRSASSLAFAGTSYLLTWSEAHGGSSDLWGARVTPSAALLGDAAFRIAASDDVERSGATACTKSGACLVAYERYDSSPAVHSMRIAGRVVVGPASPPPSGAAPPAIAPVADADPLSTDGGGEPSADAGCACQLRSPTTSTPLSWFGALVVGLLVARRRRR